MDSLIETACAEPIDELVQNDIAWTASQAAVALCDFCYWKEERERRRSLDFNAAYKLAIRLTAVAASSPGDDVTFALHNNGVKVLSGYDDRTKAWDWFTEVILALQSFGENTDLDVALGLRETCLLISRRSSPYEGPVIRYEI